MIERVVKDPRILRGKPVIAGTRVPVSLVLNLLAHGYDAARGSKPRATPTKPTEGARTGVAATAADIAAAQWDPCLSHGVPGTRASPTKRRQRGWVSGQAG